MKYINASKLLFAISFTLLFVACVRTNQHELIILHTNDTHSQIEPLEKNTRDANCGGYARRMGFIKQVREEHSNVLLVDAGDFSQGTPYFNFYRGRIEIEAMNRMSYDAATLGNHEFDNGIDTLTTILKEANFPIVCSNYDVTLSPLEGIVKPYSIRTISGVKIGIIGIGVNPTGLISDSHFHPIAYLDPILSAQQTASFLKNKKRCDLVICLSHQGTHDRVEGQLSDVRLAQATRDIDIIIGGHTHKIVENYYVENLDGDSVLLAQMGKSGARIGQIWVQMSK
jgi:5'-nucleotidase